MPSDEFRRELQAAVQVVQGQMRMYLARIAALETENAALKCELEIRDSKRRPCVCCGEPVSCHWDEWMRDGSKELWHTECAQKWLARLSNNFLTFGQGGANFEEAQRLAYQCEADQALRAENDRLRATLAAIVSHEDAGYDHTQCIYRQCRRFHWQGHTEDCPIIAGRSLMPVEQENASEA